jgi:hypothetical protein
VKREPLNFCAIIIRVDLTSSNSSPQSPRYRHAAGHYGDPIDGPSNRSQGECGGTVAAPGEV